MIMPRIGWVLVSLALAVCEAFVEEKFEGDPCKLDSGESGVCRRSDACGWLRGVLIRKDEQIVNCGFDRDVAIVCCGTEGVTLRNSSVEMAVKACENNDGVHSSLAYHILNGIKAEKEEVPFIGALGYPRENPEPGESPYKWGCGCSLIAPSFLLTAAHCMVSEIGRPHIIRMGTLNLLTTAVVDDVQDRTVKNIILHPRYKKSRRTDDIAIIEVDSPFLFEAAVKPVCLRTSLEDMDTHHFLLAAGWGKTESREASPDALYLANLTTVPTDDCWQRYEMLKLGKRKALPQGVRRSQYCAIGVPVNEYERSDTCEGDSGGPLYYIATIDGAQKYYQIGITSFGLNCGSSLPSVYTRVAYYLDWIASHVWPE